MLSLATNVFQLFASGGYGGMTIISLLLIAVFFAAWKAPAWVKEIGLIAFACGFMFTLIGFMQAAQAIQELGDVAPNIIWGGVKVALIPVVYGIIVYIISLIIRIVRKPKI
jgi:hypothetical protein